MNLFISLLWNAPQLFWYQVFVVVFSVCLHEYAHARTALFFGDDTAQQTGHLTLNPFRQMGIISLLMLIFCGIAWGAVPVDPEKLRNYHKRAGLWVSFAGPCVNLILFLLGLLMFSGLCVIAARQGDVQEFSVVAENILLLTFLFAKINALLLILNLLPISGFDGGNIMQELLSEKQKTKFSSE